MFDSTSSAEKPRNAPAITVMTTPPKGRTTPKGPSQVAGNSNAVCSGARVMLATALQDVAYAEKCCQCTSCVI